MKKAYVTRHKPTALRGARLAESYYFNGYSFRNSVEKARKWVKKADEIRRAK